MAVFSSNSAATVSLTDHAGLRRFWKSLDPLHKMLIGTVIVQKALTPAQLRRLPQDLRAKIA